MPNLAKKITDIAAAMAEKFSLPLGLILAIVTIESGGDTNAARFEPGYKWFVKNPDKPRTCNGSTERNLQATSFGLMQVMGAVAREYGFGGWLTELCKPALGIEYGCRHLKRFVDRYFDENGWAGVVASYNAGSPRFRNGAYVNQAYVDKVLAEWAEQDPGSYKSAGLVPESEGEGQAAMEGAIRDALFLVMAGALPGLTLDEAGKPRSCTCRIEARTFHPERGACDLDDGGTCEMYGTVTALFAFYLFESLESFNKTPLWLALMDSPVIMVAGRAVNFKLLQTTVAESAGLSSDRIPVEVTYPVFKEVPA